MAAILNVIAALASVAAVVSSTFLAIQALRYSKNANHMPVIVHLFKEYVSEEFVKKEEYVWREMPRQDASKGFRKLPRKIKSYATDVALFYLMISYLSEYDISDHELLALQVKYRLLKTWKVIKPHVEQERILRDGEYTFLNTLEVFVQRVSTLDSDAIARRMLARVKKEKR